MKRMQQFKNVRGHLISRRITERFQAPNCLENLFIWKKRKGNLYKSGRMLQTSTDEPLAKHRVGT